MTFLVPENQMIQYATEIEVSCHKCLCLLFVPSSFLHVIAYENKNFHGFQVLDFQISLSQNMVLTILWMVGIINHKYVILLFLLLLMKKLFICFLLELNYMLQNMLHLWSPLSMKWLLISFLLLFRYVSSFIFFNGYHEIINLKCPVLLCN